MIVGNQVEVPMGIGGFGISYGRQLSRRRSYFFPGIQGKRVMHHQATLGMCFVCGMEDENMFHSPVTHPKARALHMGSREVWKILSKEFFNILRPDWMLILLDQLTPIV